MAFESGTVSFRAFMVPQSLPNDIVQRFAAQAAPGLASLREEPIQGWVGGRHLLDRVITDENAYYAGYLRLTMLQAERKIPPALLKTEQTMEELAHLQATGLAFLNRKVRSEIRQAVIDRLLPTMPPILKGIHFLHSPSESLVYATCVSDKQLDAFQIAFARVSGFALIPGMPADIALRRKRLDVEDLASSSFSPDLDDREVGMVIGQDFLTWLWYMSESERGSIALEDGREVSALIEGPLTFQMLGEGAHLTVLRKGTPMVSAEAKTALRAGKKLKQAKCTLTLDDLMWSLTLDADQFVFRGLKLPESEERLDPISRFQNRITQLDRFMEVFLSLYDEFLARRSRPDEWQEEVLRIRHWVSERKSMH